MFSPPVRELHFLPSRALEGEQIKRVWIRGRVAYSDGYNAARRRGETFRFIKLGWRWVLAFDLQPEVWTRKPKVGQIPDTIEIEALTLVNGDDPQFIEERSPSRFGA